MSLPKELQALNTWLVRDAKKIPYYANGGKRHGAQGTPEDRAQLVTLAEAVKASQTRKMAGVGLAMVADNGLIALDFDKCVDTAGAPRPEVLELIRGTYAEISPSGTGVRAFFRGELPNNKDTLNKVTGRTRSGATFGFEVFYSKGYVTVTGNRVCGAPDTIAPLPADVRQYAAQRFSGKAQRNTGANANGVVVELTANQLRDVMTVLEHPAVLAAAADNEFWSNAVGYPLKKHGLRELWLDFSRRAPNYEPESPEKWWDTHSAGNSDFRHLLVEAERVGCPNPAAHKSELARPEEFQVIARASPSPRATDSIARKPLRFETLPEDVLTRAFPERKWALYPYLPAATTTLLSSVGGFGKSHALILLAICKALGLSYFCDRACSPGRVVILSAEDDLPEMQRRTQRVLRYLKSLGVEINPTLLRANLQFVDMTGNALGNLLVHAQHMGAVPTDLAEHIAAQVGSAEIVAIDTLSRFSGASENDNTVAAAFISACEVIAKKTGAAVLVLSHTGKQVAREGIVDQYMARGASAFSDNARSVMVLASPLEAQFKEYEIDAAEVRRGEMFRLAHVKSNYARKAEDVFFKRLDDGVVVPFKPKAKRAPSEDELTMQLLAYIGAAEITHSKLKAGFAEIFGDGIQRKRAEEVYKRAVREGKLVLSRRYNQADYYKVADRSLKAMLDAPVRTNPPESFFTKPGKQDDDSSLRGVDGTMDLIGVSV